MLTIRLQRVGRKNDPSFRVILVESKRAAKTGDFNEVLGSYNPRTDAVALKVERIKHWISMGATVSDTVHNLLVSQKVIEGKKINVLPRKTVPKVEGEGAEAENAPAEAAPSEGAETPAEPEGDNAVAEEKAAA